ncbi:Uncharacterised protein [Vibrio cholerae]|nr:Uncharacterised protein [Vibrio cholerae]
MRLLLAECLMSETTVLAAQRQHFAQTDQQFKFTLLC